jgi:hypothetical protein
MKKLLLLTFLLIFACQSISFAAISGSKGISVPRSAPSTSQPASSSSSSSYKPSAPATSYSDKAPAAKSQQQQAQQSTGSSFLRNAGLLGGGMLLGSMLGGMFGAGSSGMFSQILGMLFNAIAIGLIFMAGRYIWNKFQESRKPKDTRRFR